MAHEEDYARFFAYLNLFCGAMLVLVLGDSLPVMFVGWEGVGLCSYLLIGFWYTDTANADAGKKAFITNRIGDFGFLLGMFLLFQYSGTMSFTEITDVAAPGSALMQPFWLGQSVAFWVGVLLFIGACGKSAQIPLYVWLPDAMAGPTPVSALIHAATMVTAGVYMVARLHAVYLLSPARDGDRRDRRRAHGGVRRDHRLRAERLQEGAGLLDGQPARLHVRRASAPRTSTRGVFHLFTHAFFKAGLFLCAGSVMHAMSGSGDITRMGGLRNKIPWTHGVFFVCWLAICGLPMFSGFFSKDAIIAGAFATKLYPENLAWVGKLVAFLLMASALGTAFYMSRLYFLVFSGPSRADAETQHHIHESPGVMVGPLVLLAIGAVLSGYVGIPGALFEHPELNVHRARVRAGARRRDGDPALDRVGLHGDLDRARRGRHRPGVRLLRRRLPRAGAPGRLPVPALRRAGAGQVPHRRALRLSLHPPAAPPVAAAVPVRRPDPHRQDRWSRGWARWSTCWGASRASSRWATRSATWRCSRSASPRWSSSRRARRRPASSRSASRGSPSRSTPAGRARGSPRELEYAFDFDDGREENQTAPETRHAYHHPGRYTIRVTVTDPKWGTSTQVKRRVEVQ